LSMPPLPLSSSSSSYTAGPSGSSSISRHPSSSEDTVAFCEFVALEIIEGVMSIISENEFLSAPTDFMAGNLPGGAFGDGVEADRRTTWNEGCDQQIDGVVIGELEWVPDSLAFACTECKKGFALFRRRHHCRLCGHVFCNDCTKARLVVPTLSPIRCVRVCRACAQSNIRWSAVES